MAGAIRFTGSTGGLCPPPPGHRVSTQESTDATMPDMHYGQEVHSAAVSTTANAPVGRE